MRNTAYLSLIAAITLPLAALSQQPAIPELPKIDTPDYLSLFEEKSYAKPEDVLAEMKTLEYPWNHVFMAPPKGPKGIPEGYDWAVTEVVLNEKTFASVSASLTAHYLHSGKHAAVLLEKGTDGKLKVADLIIRHMNGFNSFDPSTLKPFKDLDPYVLFRGYEGGRRDGRITYEMFRIVSDEDGMQWQSVLQIPAQYDQTDVSEECEILTDGNGTLLVKLSREWIRLGKGPETENVELAWNDGEGKFFTEPLRGKLVLMPKGDALEVRVPEVVDDAELDIIEVGSIGGLKIGSTEDDVRAAVDAKIFKGEEFEEGATGSYIQEWLVPAEGLTLKMGSEKPGGSKSVDAITISAPSKMKTAKGVGIGTPEADAIKAYKDFKSEADEGFLNGEDSHLVGSIYGGMIIRFEDGKVFEIFLGAAAE